MNNQRRALLATSGLAALVVAGCAATGSTSTAGVQSVFSAVQFVLPLLEALATGISLAVPAAAPILAVVMPYLGQAGPVFQTLSAAMTAVAAMPIVQQISGYVTAAFNAVAGVVNTAAAGSKLAGFSGLVSEAQAALAVIVAFVSGVQGMPAAAMAPRPMLLHV
jgi:phage-related protein